MGSRLKTIRIAVLSDIHGNRWALETVLADIQRRRVNGIVNLGDCLYGPLDPAGTACILMELGWPTVRGNEDRIILEQEKVDEVSPTLRIVRDHLDAAHLKWIEDLSMTAVVDETFFLCHGSPWSDTEYLLVEVSEQGVALRSPQVLLDLTIGIAQPVVLCGHDHVPRTVRLPNGKLIVNPGSVGLPAYQDDSPSPHVMETGTPHARYSIVSGSEAGWQVEDVAVPYDWDAASRAAHENGRVDWAEWLCTGRANGGN